MDPKVEKLFQGKNLIFIATINTDGSPQLTPVWGNYTDNHILINTAEGRIKHRNVKNDPRVAVSVVEHDNPLNMTTIKGKVTEIILTQATILFFPFTAEMWLDAHSFTKVSADIFCKAVLVLLVVIGVLVLSL